MVSATSSTLTSAKIEARKLFAQREAIEVDLEAAMTQLKATGTGPNDSLVDKEGFPREDAFEVRGLRQKVIRLKNDLAKTNGDMEAALHRAHAAAR